MNRSPEDQDRLLAEAVAELGLSDELLLKLTRLGKGESAEAQAVRASATQLRWALELLGKTTGGKR